MKTQTTALGCLLFLFFMGTTPLRAQHDIPFDDGWTYAVGGNVKTDVNRLVELLAEKDAI